MWQRQGIRFSIKEIKYSAKKILEGQVPGFACLLIIQYFVL